MGAVKLALSVIWLVFAALFLILGRWHWIESKSAMPPFELTKREMDRPDSGVRFKIDIGGTPLDKPLADFVKDFNEYLSAQNDTSRKANLRAAWGYFVAALTALFSMFLQWLEPFQRWKSSRKPCAC
jgi:hypothetical protein